jgi:FeS assembly SUF system protein
MEQTAAPSLKSQVIAALKTCYDPEIPVNIYELGLIYELDVSEQNEVHVKMTLTTPNCPVADRLPRDVEAKVRAIPGVADVKVELVWEPPWDMSKMSDVARLSLGFDLETPKAPPLTRLGS